MLIYEVNLDVDKDIAEAFLEWLTTHIEEIVTLEGFTGAQLFERDNEEGTDKTLWTTHYFLTDRTSYENYLQNHAPAFRQDGLDKFGGKFMASRRVLTPIEKF